MVEDIKKINIQDIKKYYEFLNHSSQSELRLIEPSWKTKKPIPKQIWVNSEEEFVKEVEKNNGKYNMYVGINERSSEGKTDADIKLITNIGHDIDAHSGTSESFIAAQEVALKMKDDCIKRGYQEPLVICSGRGFWVIHHVSPIENTELNVKKIKAFGSKLKKKYEVEGIELDSTVYNPSRIARIPGTMNISDKDNPVLSFIVNEPSSNEDCILCDDILNIEVEEYSKNFSANPNVSNGICSFMDYCLTHEIPKGERHAIISRNMAIYISDHPDRELLKEQYSKIQKGSPTELDQWLTNIDKNGKNKYPFSIGQLVNFTRKYKIPFDWKTTPEYRNWLKEKRAERELENEIGREKKAEEFGKAIRYFTDKRHLAEQFIKVQPIFYDEYKLWWIWRSKKFSWEIIDETDVMNKIAEHSEADTISSKEKNEILESLKQVSRLKKPEGVKPTWIQFKNLIVDIETGEELEATPNYFITNPIPWALNKERQGETPEMDRILKEWVGEDYIKSLYQILAYCLLPDYPIHRLFCFIGGGMNGKSCFLRLLQTFVGQDNVTATELDVLLASRFEVTRLHKKLVCMMGETNFSEMSKTSILKKLTGQDTIGFEYKNKTPFEGENYAKILLATNNLPTTSDKTIGFYRRWMIIDFPNQFSEQTNILDQIPEEEYGMLAVKCIGILSDLLVERRFHMEGSIEERMKRYEDKSDPLEKFIKEFTDDEPDNHIFKWEFEKKLNQWCDENRFRHMADTTIGRKMKEKGFETGQITIPWEEGGFTRDKKIRAWIGIKWQEDNAKEQVEQE